MTLHNPIASTDRPHFFLLLGATIIVFMGLLLLISTAFLMLGFSLAWYLVPLAAIADSLFVWWGAGLFFPQARRRMFFITSASAVAAFIGIALLNGWIYDTSWDGQNYHYEALLQLVNGWNPFYGHPTNAFYVEHLEHFPKGPWINAVALYRLTGNIEQAKAFHMLLMLAAYWLSVAALSTFRTLKPRWVVVLSLLATFNPVSVCQLFTFYVDGFMASLVLIIVSLFILLYRQPNKLLMVTAATAILILVNIKLTGVIYAAILGLSYSAWAIYQRKQYRFILANYLLAGYLTGVLLVGYNPYITQYVRQFLSTGNPFYPTSLEAFIPLEDNVPRNFLEMNRWEKLVASFFATSQETKGPSHYKWPFTVTFEEIRAFYAPDVRTAGFGPFFSGVTLLTVTLWIVAAARYRRRMRLAAILIVLLAAIFLSGLSNPEAWWARFVPQWWLLPLLTLLLILLTTPRGWLHRLSGLVTVLLYINLALIASPYLSSAIVRSAMHAQQLSQLKNTNERIIVTFNHFVSVESRFKEWGIEYQSVDVLPCTASQQHTIIGTETRFCAP